MPDALPVLEGTCQRPINTYGRTKLMGEQILRDACAAHGLGAIALRYFNAGGADPEGELGEEHDPETHIIPLLLQAAQGTRPDISIFGSDYDTPDGTCVRDYVHVNDLAAAHLAVLPLLEERSLRYNLGNGAGYSVKQVIESVERISGRRVPHSFGPRRPGDPAALVASSEALRRETGWQPRFAALDDIVRTAWAWHEGHPRGYADRG